MQIDRQGNDLSGNVELLLIDESLDAFSKLEEINEIFDGRNKVKHPSTSISQIIK